MLSQLSPVPSGPAVAKLQRVITPTYLFYSRLVYFSLPSPPIPLVSR